MSLILNCILIIVGLFLVVKGADWLVEGASTLAKKFGIPTLVIGLTIVAFGTSLPELIISLTSALAGSPDMSIGNIVGSNIANVLLILGLCALVAKLTTQKSTVKVELPMVVAGALILLLLVNDHFFDSATQNMLGRNDGILLLLLFVAFLFYSFSLIKNNPEPKSKDKNVISKKGWQIAGMILLGLIALIGGGQLAVNNSADLARTLGMSEALIGLTILAVGSSLPELITSFVAAKKGESDLAIGNIVGSNLFNTTFILGLTSLISPIPFSSALNVDLIFYVFVALLLFFTIKFSKDNTINKKMGFIFLVLYLVYLIFIISRG